MNLPFFIARRYLVSKKEKNAINIITLIAVTGVMVGTTALVCVLSAFNGIEQVVIGLFNAFDPPIKITAEKGKYFELPGDTLELVMGTEGVEAVSFTLEENAMLRYGQQQYIATLKGVDEHFRDMSRLDTMLISGQFELEREGAPMAVFGYGVAGALGVNVTGISSVGVYMPKEVENVNTNPEKAFKVMPVYPAGVFSIQHDFDTRYVIVPLSFMQELTEQRGKVSALEINLKDDAKPAQVKEKLIAILGPGFKVSDRFEQHEAIYKIMKSERLAVFVILSFILVIATFNIVGSVTMLIIEKRKDIRILHHLGASLPVIRRIFFTEGMLITLTGLGLGLMLGFILCYIQQQFGLITIPGAFVMEAYPVDMRQRDFALITLIVLTIGAVTSYIPAGRIGSANVNVKG